jgi:Zn-dependent protease with chaperone function
VPNEVVEQELRRFASRPPTTKDPPFGYPGEAAALTLAMVGSVLILAVLGLVSVGLFVVVVALSLTYLLADIATARTRMIRVTPKDFSRVFKLAKLAAYRLRVALPDVFIAQSADYNAYTRGFLRKGYVVVHSALAKDFPPSEVLFVLGHEMGHMKRFHTTWLTLMANASEQGSRFLLAPLIRVVFNVWSVRCEYTADQAGFIACRDPRAATMALLRLAGGSESQDQVCVEDMIGLDANDPEMASEMADLLGTHPAIRNRLRRINDLAMSPSFSWAIAR